jgi:predicted TIM-barrel fold metal-dependent hydrolase
VIVDFQQHYTPPELLKGNRDTVSVQLDEHGNPSYLLNPLLSDLAAHVRMMDRAGIDAGVLTCGSGFDQPDLKICRLINDRMKRAADDFPGRFIGLAHVPALKPAEAAAELKRCAADLGLPGVVIGSELQGQALDSEALRPFWRAAADLGLYVFIHPLPNVIRWEHMDADDLGRMLGWQFSLMVAAVRMINSGLFDELPTLNVQFSHFAAGLGRYLGRIRGFQQRDKWGTAAVPRHGRRPKLPFDHYSRADCSTTAPGGLVPITPRIGARNGCASDCRRSRSRRQCSRPTIRRPCATRMRLPNTSPGCVRWDRTRVPWSTASMPRS